MWTLLLEFNAHTGLHHEIYLPFFNTGPECLGWIDSLQGLLKTAGAELTRAECTFRPTATLS